MSAVARLLGLRVRFPPGDVDVCLFLVFSIVRWEVTGPDLSSREFLPSTVNLFATLTPQPCGLDPSRAVAPPAPPPKKTLLIKVRSQNVGLLQTVIATGLKARRSINLTVLKTAVVVVCMCTFGKEPELLLIYCENNSCNPEFVTFQSKLYIFASL